MTAERRVLIVAHTGRDSARAVASKCVDALVGNGIAVRLIPAEAGELGIALGGLVETASADAPGQDCELAMVIGGDGTILRAAELTRSTSTPLLGVNLGHVGFLAEAEEEDITNTIDAIVHKSYTTEDRMAIDVTGSVGGATIFSTFALNEASIEKTARERMIEILVEIDGRPVSEWSCDGLVVATPTGSTAYNFSAGGPVVWPTVEAVVVTPLSAHALFARPLVVAPSSVVNVTVWPTAAAVLSCDGRRSFDLVPGARVEVRRSGQPIRLVRIHQAPFTDRLVAKFDLPVAGWRATRSRREVTP